MAIARHQLTNSLTLARNIDIAWHELEASGRVSLPRRRAIWLEVNFGREAATRAAKGQALLPPFAPAAET